MADEPKAPSVLDSALDSVAGTIESVLFPSDHRGAFGEFIHKWFNLKGWVDWAGDWGISRGALVTALYAILMLTAANMMPVLPDLIAGWLLFSFPVVGPVAALMGFWSCWVWYVQSNYIFSRTNPVLLEVRMPHHVAKSPRAMEQVLTSFWIRSGTTTFIDRNWYGGVTPYAALEICSFGGEVHFYIWCRRTYKNVIEAAMYSQYPEVEVVEVEDYASKFEFDPRKYSCFVTDYIYDNNHQDEASDVYPTLSYHDFELEEEPEEHTVDPYGSVIEVLSAFNHEEQGWIQIVLRGNFKKDWMHDVHHEVEKIRREASKTEYEDPETGAVKEKLGGFPRPTEIQKEQMHAMERHMGKLVFDVGLRGIYIAPAGRMRSAEFTAFRWIWRPFNNPNWMNAIRPRRAHNDFDYAWQDWNGMRYNLVTRRYFDMYRRRQFFHSPWNIVKPIRMSVESIATLWHPPSTVVVAPGLARIHVAKAEPPHDLPI